MVHIQTSFIFDKSTTFLSIELKKPFSKFRSYFLKKICALTIVCKFPLNIGAWSIIPICHRHYNIAGVCRFVEQNCCNLSIANEECSTMTSYE